MFNELKRVMPLVFQTVRQRGVSFLLKEMVRYIRFGPIPLALAGKESYHRFIERVESIPTRHEAENQIKAFQQKPFLSVIVPVYNVSSIWLNKCIESVTNQYYQNWELCLYDDCSTNLETINCLKSWEGKDSRIKIQFGTQNGHISIASNKAIEMATGEFICLLDNDDEITAHALFEIVSALNNNPQLDFIYSDEDFLDEEGGRIDPHFKSDFNLELLLNHNYITHFATIRKSLGDRVGWFRQGCEGAQDHDLFLRISEQTKQIHHIPKILYHWRRIETSTASNYGEKSYAHKAALKVLNDYASRNNIKAEILPGPGTGAYRFKRQVNTKGKVTIIIPFKDQVNLLKPCVKSIIDKAGYENYEILLVSNNSEEQKTFDYLKKISSSDEGIRVLEYNIPFNYSKINNWAVSQTDAEYILLLNNDTKAISQGWLSAMMEYIQLDNVGAVGAKLLYADKTVQHAGVIVGIAGIAGHSHRFFPDSSNGYFYRPNVPQNLSAVTGACLLTKRQLWEKVDGLDEDDFKIAFNDIDYCLKIKNLGYHVVYTPNAKLFHYESKSRGYEDSPQKQKRFKSECKTLQNKWRTNEYIDPFYNPNLSLNSENFRIN